jgi:hypothetical protein
MRGARNRSVPSNGERLARGLGYVSIALGIAEIVAPRAICRAIGLEGRERLVLAFGMREVANGVAILASHDPAPWVAARVAGDAMDIAAVAAGLRDADEDDRHRLGLAAAALAGVACVDLACVATLHDEKRLGRTDVDYADRSGFPRPAPAMRGAAGDFIVPDDMRIPQALRPYTAAEAERRTGNGSLS